MEALGCSVLAGLAAVVLATALELKSGLYAFLETRKLVTADPRAAIGTTCNKRQKACRVKLYWHGGGGWSSPCGTRLPALPRRYYRIELTCQLGKFKIYRRTSVVLR